MPNSKVANSSASAYARSKPAENTEEKYARTLKRLERLRDQLAASAKGTKLAGKVCVVTGTGSKKGIGRATAYAYAHEGAAHLYLLDYVGESLPELEASLKKQYPETKVTVIQGDAADDCTIASICQRAIDEEGRLDVFFANAGIASSKLMSDIAPEAFMEMIRINVLSCFLAIKHSSKAMSVTSKAKEESAGSIILTASVAGLRSGAGPVDYSASKAAVNSLAKTSAYQLAGTQVRVNTLCPGLIETGMTTATFEFSRSKGSAGRIGQINPLQRYGIAEEIAQVALFLACDDSSYVNGQNIAVDGGLSASHPVVPGRWA